MANSKIGEKEYLDADMNGKSNIKNSDEEDNSTINDAAEHLRVFKDLKSFFCVMDRQSINQIINKHFDDKQNVTLLHLAVLLNSPAAVEQLLDLKANVNAVNVEKSTPLHLAESRTIAELLLENGADINAKDDYGSSPLSEAATLGHRDVVKFLLEKGADSSEAKKYLGLPIDCDDEQLLHVNYY